MTLHSKAVPDGNGETFLALKARHRSAVLECFKASPRPTPLTNGFEFWNYFGDDFIRGCGVLLANALEHCKNPAQCDELIAVTEEAFFTCIRELGIPWQAKVEFKFTSQLKDGVKREAVDALMEKRLSTEILARSKSAAFSGELLATCRACISFSRQSGFAMPHVDGRFFEAAADCVLKFLRTSATREERTGIFMQVTADVMQFLQTNGCNSIPAERALIDLLQDCILKKLAVRSESVDESGTSDDYAAQYSSKLRMLIEMPKP